VRKLKKITASTASRRKKRRRRRGGFLSGQSIDVGIAGLHSTVPKKDQAWSSYSGCRIRGTMRSIEVSKSNFNHDRWNFPGKAYRNIMGIVIDWRTAHAC
jgi:hypothetical protein